MSNRFAEHEYTKLPGNWHKWAKPGTNIDMLCFNIFHGTLIVIGDLGDAIYRWDQAVTLEWIAGCNLDYFVGKCQASEVGRDFKEWDAGDCHDDLERWAKEKFDNEDLERPFELQDAFDSLNDGKHSWEHFLYENAYELFGDDWWDYVGSFGTKIHIRAKLHLEALKAMIGV